VSESGGSLVREMQSISRKYGKEVESWGNQSVFDTLGSLVLVVKPNDA
jgi:hypothetical protein